MENLNEVTSVSEVKRGISGSTLKIIAIISMFIDHFAAILLTGIVMADYPADIANYTVEQQQAWINTHQATYDLINIVTLLRLVGRFGFPLFAFLLVEGFTHTHNLKKYIRNLFIFALISELPFDLGFNSTLIYPDYQNVFFTLLLGVLAMAGIKYLGQERTYKPSLAPISYLIAFIFGGFIFYVIYSILLYYSGMTFDFTVIKFWYIDLIAGALGLLIYIIVSRKKDASWRNRFTFSLLPVIICALLGDILKTDYGTCGVIVIVVMYLLRSKKTKSFGFGCLILTLMNYGEFSSFFMLPLVKRYNGKRGLSLKYFFYIFYPAHILILYLITYLLGYADFTLI